MKQVTLVMLYGPKPSDLSALIADCQTQVAKILGNCFQPYSIHQVHATLVSLARVPGSTMTNLYLDRYRNQQRIMDIPGLLNFIRTGGHFPFQIQMGGFQRRDYPFVSQGQRPYERSFSILGNEVAIALLIGWPVRGKPVTAAEANTLNLIQEARIYPTVLDDTRQAIQTFNILHKYYRELTDADNDFYFRIGLIHQSPVNYSLRESVRRAMRQYLSSVKPIITEVAVSDIYVVSYQDESLPLDSTKIWPVNDAKVTPEFIWSLYE